MSQPNNQTQIWPRHLIDRTIRCPRCGLSLVTDGTRTWCSFLGNLVASPPIPACDYESNSTVPLPPKPS